jgi:hypothetical protein
MSLLCILMILFAVLWCGLGSLSFLARACSGDFNKIFGAQKLHPPTTTPTCGTPSSLLAAPVRPSQGKYAQIWAWKLQV